MKLQKKILLQVLVISSFLFGTSAYFEARQQRLELDKMGSEFHRTMVINSLGAFGNGLWTLDNQAIEASIMGLFESKTVFRVQVVSNEGVLHMGRERAKDDSHKILEIENFVGGQNAKENTLDLAKPNTNYSKTASAMVTGADLDLENRRLMGTIWRANDAGTNEFIGHVILDYSTSEAQRMINRSLFRLAISGVVMTMCLSMLLVLFMRKSIVNPIAELANASQEIAKGNFETNVFVRSQDEIGLLALNFIKMRDQVKAFTNDLQKMVDEKTAQVVHQKKKIQEILNNLQQGIVTFDKSFKVEEEFSPFVCSLYKKKPQDVVGANVIDLILPESELSASAKSDCEFALKSIVGENLFGYELNQGHLLKEALVIINQEKYDLEFDWIPIYDDHSNVERMMLSVRDMTKQKQLEREIKEKGDAFAQQMKRISDMIVCDRFMMSKSFSDGEERLKKARAHLESHQGNPKEAFVHLHTLKGNFRTLGIRSIAELVHSAEELVHIWRDEGKLDRETSLKRLEEVENCFNQYQDDYKNVFAGNSESKERAFENLLAVVHSISSPFIKSVVNAKLEFGAIEVKDSISHWNTEFLGQFRDVIVHSFNNTLDHGHVLPQGRGIKVGPVHIAVESYQTKNGVNILIRDNGAGVYLEGLKALAEKKGVPFNPEDPFAILFSGGFSTAEKVTETSGRGVGMSALADFARGHKGQIKARSNQPHGVIIEFSFPLEVALNQTPTSSHDLPKKIAA